MHGAVTGLTAVWENNRHIFHCQCCHDSLLILL